MKVGGEIPKSTIGIPDTIRCSLRLPKEVTLYVANYGISVVQAMFPQEQ